MAKLPQERLLQSSIFPYQANFSHRAVYSGGTLLLQRGFVRLTADDQRFTRGRISSRLHMYVIGVQLGKTFLPNFLLQVPPLVKDRLLADLFCYGGSPWNSKGSREP